MDPTPRLRLLQADWGFRIHRATPSPSPRAGGWVPSTAARLKEIREGDGARGRGPTSSQLRPEVEKRARALAGRATAPGPTQPWPAV